jgi:hypothetical protein
MQQHAIPQNVTSFEFKIVGFLTLKQFGMLGACAVLGFISFMVIANTVLRISFVIFFVGLGILLTFGSIQQIPFYRWIFIFIKAIFSPTQRIWVKSASAPEYFYTAFATDIKPVEKRVFEDRSKLSSYLQTLPSTSRNAIDMIEQQRLQSLSLQNNNSAKGIARTQVPNIPPQLSANTPIFQQNEDDQNTVMPAHDIHLQQKPQTNQLQGTIPPTAPVQMPKLTQTQSTPHPLPPIPTPPPVQVPQKPLEKPVEVPKPTPPTPPTPSFTLPTPPPPLPPQNQREKPMPPLPAKEPAAPTPPIQQTPQQQSSNIPVIQTPVQTNQPITMPSQQTGPNNTPQPKYWSSMQKMEREYLEELKKMQQDEQKQKEELKSSLMKDFETKQQEMITKKEEELRIKEKELKEKEQKLMTEKQSQIEILESKLQEQNSMINKIQSDFKQKEETYINELQTKLTLEKSKREEFEKAAKELNNKIAALSEEKTKTEEQLKDKQQNEEQKIEDTQRLKEQLDATTSQIETLKQEAAQKMQAEQERQQNQNKALKDEVEQQKQELTKERKAVDDEKMRIENEHKELLAKIEQEKDKLIKQNQALIEEKNRLEKVNNELIEKQKELQKQTEKQEENTTDIPLPPITPKVQLTDMSKIDDLDKLAAQLHDEATKIDKDASKFTPKAKASTQKTATLPRAPLPPKVVIPTKVTEQKTITDLTAASIPPITNLINVINGVVYDKAGNFVPNVIIIVKDMDKAPVRALKTNRLGQFAISTPLPNGTYTMEFEDSKEEKVFDFYQITLSGSVVPPIEIKEKD